MNIDKILLPLDFLDLPLHVVHQAAALAHHFHSEMVLLHVVTSLSYPAGVFEDRHKRVAHDLLTEIVARAQAKLDESLAEELEGLVIKRVMRRGDPAAEIVQAAHDENAKLVVIPTHSRGVLERFLLGSVTAKVLHHCGCPVWTDSHPQPGATRKLDIRNVLCAVDFSQHSRNTLDWAAKIAAEFGAQLTLAHITPGVEKYGPGGNYVDREWKEALVGSAGKQIAALQQDAGIQSQVIIASGDVPKTLSRVAKQANADLLVVGCRPSGGRLRANSYAIISESPIPVLSV